MLVVYWVKLQIAFTATSSMQQLLRINRHSAVTWYRKQKHEMWIECVGEEVTITHQNLRHIRVTKEETEGKNYQKKGPPLTIHCCVRAKNSNKCIHTFTSSSENGTNWPWTKVIHVLFGSVEEHQQLLRHLMVCNVSQECVVSLWSALSLKDESLLRLETWFVKLSVPSILA